MGQKKLRKQWLRKVELLNAEKQDVYHLSLWQRRYVNVFNRYIIEHHQLIYGSRILVIGCFSGRLLYALDQYRKLKGTYIDQSPKLMTAAIHFYPHYSYRLLESTALPFRTGKFDCVICSIPVECFIHQEQMLKEIERVGEQVVFYHTSRQNTAAKAGPIYITIKRKSQQ